MIILGIDPGTRNTGFAVIDSKAKLLHRETLKIPKGVPPIPRILKATQRIVSEHKALIAASDSWGYRFKTVVKMADAQEVLRNQLSLLMARAGGAFITVKAITAKSVYPDQYLASIGFDTRVNDHVLDAMRHALWGLDQMKLKVAR